MLIFSVLWFKGIEYRLLWFVRGDGFGSVAVMVKEELCEKVVEIERVRDGVVAVVMVLEQDVLSLICGYFSAHEEVWRKNNLF